MKMYHLRYLLAKEILYYTNKNHNHADHVYEMGWDGIVGGGFREII